MGHILSLFAYLLTTSVSGGYPGNKLPGYGSPSCGRLAYRSLWTYPEIIFRQLCCIFISFHLH